LIFANAWDLFLDSTHIEETYLKTTKEAAMG
jgi:hypothetical protein